ncbi:MAG: hypothetical protein SO122_07620, partial [Eubacteriales bacterium]|nr:hypothetical protein [Eubacteriales bacterium]
KFSICSTSACMQHAALYHPNDPFAKRRQSSNRCDGKNDDGERKCFPNIIGKGKNTPNMIAVYNSK